MEAPNASMLSRLRECNQRANAARAAGNSSEYRRLIEEFLFLSHAAATELVPTSTNHASALPIPHLLIFECSSGLTHLLREGLIEYGFAAHVTRIPSLPALSAALAGLDYKRRTMFIITDRLTLDGGLAAIHDIRKHPQAKLCPILVLTYQLRGPECALAISAGATEYGIIPENIQAYRPLRMQIERMISDDSQSRVGHSLTWGSGMTE